MRGVGRDTTGRVGPSDDDGGLAGLPDHGSHVNLPQAMGKHLEQGIDCRTWMNGKASLHLHLHIY